jgi:hypothetical protein
LREQLRQRIAGGCERGLLTLTVLLLLLERGKAHLRLLPLDCLLLRSLFVLKEIGKSRKSGHALPLLQREPVRVAAA